MLTLPSSLVTRLFVLAFAISVVLIVAANGVRLLASAAGALMAIYWFGFGAIGFFTAVAIGFCAFAAMAASIMLRVKVPATTPS